jgi:hypothetical protein
MIQVKRIPAFATIIVGVKLFPGVNLLSDAEYKLIAESEVFKEEKKLGFYKIGKEIQSETSDAAGSLDNIKGRAAEIAKEIASVNVASAKEIIDALNDAYVLKAIAESDGRRGVADAVEARLNSINAQEGSDLTPESKPAPEGDGSDFGKDIGEGKKAQSGEEGHTAVPALKDKDK